jgi:hypothetical protein
MATVERIDISLPEDVLAENEGKHQRMARTQQRRPVDRIPVLANNSFFMPLKARGVSFDQFVADPLENLRQQLLNHKWQLENVRDDAPVDTDAVTVSPELGCVRGVEFPLGWRWPSNQPPKCVHLLSEPEQIDTLKVPHPASGLNARRIEWYHAMRGLAERFDVRLNGRRLEVRVNFSHPGGPIPSAFALAGENLLAWMLTEPDRAHRLMHVVTESFIQGNQYVDELLGRPADHPLWMGADIAEMLSPDLFRVFVVPYYRRVWQAYSGRPREFHMCGRIDHLLEIIRDKLEIDHLSGFGFPTDRRRLADILGGRVRLTGGPSPMLVRDGAREEVVGACIDYIRTLGPRGGYTLTPGGDMLPDTPAQRLAWMVEASRQAS